MKRIVLALFFCFSTKTAVADEWLGKDKPQHFVISMGLGALGNHILPNTITGYERTIYGALISFAPGLVKEVVDGRTPGKKFSNKDLLWDAMGSIAGSVLYDTSVRVFYRQEPSSKNSTLYITYNGTF